jgi:uncharacterized protein (TIGR02453 family)
MPAFSGFPPETFAYLADLQAHNKRSWFEANRDRYETLWKEPALDFIAAIGPKMARLDPPMRAEPKLNGSLRRINRDVRFGADKSPYQAHLHMIFWPGDHPNRGAGFHLVLSPEGVGYGAGRWALDGAALTRYRDRVCDPMDRTVLMAALAEAEAVGCHMDEPHLARVPKGFSGDPEWDYLLRYKGVVVRTMEGALMPDWIGTPKAVDEVLSRAERLMPLIAWLHAL